MIPNHGPAMDFALGEAADAIRETTQRFSADRIAPIAADIDRENSFPRSGAVFNRDRVHEFPRDHTIDRHHGNIPQICSRG